MNIDRNQLEAMICEILKEQMGEPQKITDPSGVITVDPAHMTLDKFPFPIESDRVWLKDIYDLEESPRMGCGIMELEDTCFEWTLQYDEIDYIIDGSLDIIVDGRTVSSKAGNILLIPKGTKVKFAAEGKVRFMYVVYPANWFEQ